MQTLNVNRPGMPLSSSSCCHHAEKTRPVLLGGTLPEKYLEQTVTFDRPTLELRGRRKRKLHSVGNRIGCFKNSSLQLPKLEPLKLRLLVLTKKWN